MQNQTQDKAFTAAVARLQEQLLWLSSHNLETTSFVVTSTCGTYIIEKHPTTGNAEISLGHIGYIFKSRYDAEKVARGVKSRNGKGAITWQVMNLQDYATLHIPSLQLTLDTITGHLGETNY